MEEQQQYIVSARKYRPDSFDTMIGQEALTSTLKAAILSNKTAHAYLFCGPRGVGKTSTARVFAKTINCLNRSADGEACNECESCRAFNEQRSLNIYELDAASNNTVDDIRKLIEQVQVPPQIGTKKVYIIDEVHMLSQAAFNAFLKTLEEPPEYVIFILATTEKHKILPTILSRCQIYDFKRISVGEIVKHLSHVAEEEHIKADQEALGIIAEKADGGMRDALSLFDRIANFGGGEISYEAVVKGLNILDYEYYFQFVEQFISGDFRGVLVTLDELLGKGFDAAMIVNGMASFLRNLMMAKAPETLHLVEKPQSVVQRFANVASQCPSSFLFKAIANCVNCDKDYKAASDKRLLVELTFMSISALYSKELRGDNAQKTPQSNSTVQQPRQSGTTTQTNTAKQQQSTQPQVSAANQQRPIQSAAQTIASRPITQATAPKQTIQQRPISPASGARTRLSVHLGDRKAAALQEQSTVQEIKDHKDINEEDLQRAWYGFKDEVLTEQVHLKHTMEECLPHLKGNDRFEVQIFNDAQEAELKDIQDKLLEYLRTKLSNGRLVMEIGHAVLKPEERPLSDTEQIISWRKENKAVDKLFSSLGLQPS